MGTGNRVINAEMENSLKKLGTEWINNCTIQKLSTVIITELSRSNEHVLYIKGIRNSISSVSSRKIYVYTISRKFQFSIDMCFPGWNNWIFLISNSQNWIKVFRFIRRRNGDLLEEFREWGKKKKSGNDIRKSKTCIHSYTLTSYMLKLLTKEMQGFTPCK